VQTHSKKETQLIIEHGVFTGEELGSIILQEARLIRIRKKQGALRRGKKQREGLHDCRRLLRHSGRAGKHLHDLHCPESETWGDNLVKQSIFGHERKPRVVLRGIELPGLAHK